MSATRFPRQTTASRLLVVVFILVATWMCLQLPFFHKLADPWLGAGQPRAGLITRILAMLVAEGLLLAAIFSILGRRGRRIFSLLMAMIAFLLAVNHSYLNYFGGILHIQKAREIYTLMYVQEQTFQQMTDPVFIFQVLAGCIAAAVLALLARDKATGILSRKSALFLLAFVLLLNAVIYKIQTVRARMGVGDARLILGNTTSYFIFGMFPVYASMLVETLAPDEDAPAEPPINTSVNAGNQRRPAPPLNPDAIFFIQAESLDPSALKHTSPGGIPLMPFLSELQKKSLVLERFFLHHNGAASASSEIAVLLGIKPLTGHNGFITLRTNNVHSLNRALEREGFQSFFLHSNRGSFFDRATAYREKLRFDHFFDMQYFRGDAAGFWAKDQPFFEQAMDLINQHQKPDRKTFAYMVTMQSHGPFRNYSPETRAQLSAEGFLNQPGRASNFDDYLCSMRELDNSLAYFWALLEQKNYRQPLVAVYPDHLSGVFDKPVDNQETGIAIVWSPGITPERIGEPTSAYDLGPTLAHMMTAEGRWPESAWWVGDTVFTKGSRRVIQINNMISDGDASRVITRPANPEELRLITHCRLIQN